MFNLEVKTLMFDVASGCEIFDGDKKISSAEANEVIRKACFEILGLNEKSTNKQIDRALKSPQATALFEVIEEIIVRQDSYGWKDNEFFNNYVETRNIADGDRTDFWTDDEVFLTVAKVSGDHHDLTIQRLGAGSSFTVPTSKYGVKIGGDIRLFLAGRQDWGKMVEAVAKAFTRKIQETIYGEFITLANTLKVTAGFTSTGPITSSTKPTLDAIIQNVEDANDGAQVVIMGTKTALKTLNGLAGNGSGVVDWVPEYQKEEIAKTGILGAYEGTTLLEIPNRFADPNLSSKLVDTDGKNRLYIFPLVADFKPIKFVDGGEVTLEVSQIGETMDDMHTLEVQRWMGVGSISTRQFGYWEI